jgi:hypothetical protein
MMTEQRKLHALTDTVGSIEWKEEPLLDGEDTRYSALIEDGSRLTVLDRMTGFGYRDIETGYRDSANKFWLASGRKDIRVHPELTISEAVEWVKEHANTCVGV